MYIEVKWKCEEIERNEIIATELRSLKHFEDRPLSRMNIEESLSPKEKRKAILERTKMGEKN